MARLDKSERLKLTKSARFVELAMEILDLERLIEGSNLKTHDPIVRIYPFLPKVGLFMSKEGFGAHSSESGHAACDRAPAVGDMR